MKEDSERMGSTVRIPILKKSFVKTIFMDSEFVAQIE
jgi:hypothetical protein